MTAPTLFTVCPVPICTSPVDDGQPCAECTTLIGEGLIRRVERPMTLDDARRQLADDLAARNQRAAAQDAGDACKPGQTCWVCEERRTCRHDPEKPGEWICRDCEAVQ